MKAAHSWLRGNSCGLVLGDRHFGEICRLLNLRLMDCLFGVGEADSEVAVDR